MGAVWKYFCENCTLDLPSITRTTLTSSIDDPATLQMPLVLAPHALLGGSQYTFRLSASMGEFTYSDSVIVHVNAAPVDGNVSVSPTVGESITTVFELAAAGWNDEDVPLRYRYAWRVSSTRYAWLSEQTTNSTGSAVLSNNRGVNQEIVIAVLVVDSFGAETLLDADPIEVQPYETASGENLTNTVRVHMNVSWERLAQIVGSLLVSTPRS